MDVRVYPSKLKGTIEAIPSKSVAHRALICEFLAGESGTVRYGGFTSKDIEATCDCLKELKKESPVLRVGESGSTYRFLIPIVAALNKKAEWVLEGRLPERPLLPLFEELVQGKPLTSGVYKLNAGISSQFISGLLFALPLLDGDSEIRLKGKLESAPYIDLTIDMLKKFKIKVEFKKSVFYIRGNQKYTSPGIIEVEGDWSNAAFWLIVGVTVTGLNMKSKQGDRAVWEIIKKYKNSIDAADIPDLIPILSVKAAAMKRTTTIYNAARLRLKESDRLSTVTKMLSTLGANIEEKPDGLIIHGGVRLNGGTVSSYNDHRIAMSAAIAAATVCTKPVIIQGAEAVEKSYPHFFEDFQELGGRFEWLHSTESKLESACSGSHIQQESAW
jgi:3-phosphoshikimate 1-carboxyvinyltransferase